MEIEKELKIAEREWANIRISLEGYGDIGEFDPEINIKNRLTLVGAGNRFPNYEHLTEGSFLIRNLREMERKFPFYGYLTQEAGHVFMYLASRAAERLGLKGAMAQTFGRGYSWVRTGWFEPYDGIEEEHVIKQLFFMKIFFPLGGYFKWEFNSLEVKAKLRAIVHKFIAWQDNPRSYVQDFRDCYAALEPLWHGLSSALDLPLFGSGKRYQEGFY
ncbi:MAG: hypothetical protein C4291_14270 [Candidatus Dadabacteria bacterium]